MITSISIVINNNTVVLEMVSKGAKAAFDKRINNNSCGIMIGNPNTAIIAAFCCAFAAMAARKLNTRLRLHPPNKVSPMNWVALSSGLPRKMMNKKRLSRLISSMSKELKISLARTKLTGLASE